MRGRWPKGSPARQRMSSGFVAELDLSDRMQLLSYLLRDYGPEVANYIVSRLPSGGTFFDVGANIGLVSFAVAVQRPDVTIHAFEPSPPNVVAWRRNRELNTGVTAYLNEVALSDYDGEASFHVPSDSGSGMLHDAGNAKVPITTLDGYCERNGIGHIDVLKIDVQGLEPAVLRGAERMLRASAVSTVICEMCAPLLKIAGEDSTSVIRPLKDHGFKIVRIPEAGLRRLLPGSQRNEPEDLAFEL